MFSGLTDIDVKAVCIRMLSTILYLTTVSPPVFSGGAYNYSDYQPFHKIAKELHRISRDSEFSNLFSLGKTYQKREIWALRIRNIEGVRRKTIIIDCGAHAREWIAPASCMFLIKKLTSYLESKDKRLKKVRKQFDWVLIPVLNPDGYIYTWINNDTRLWRKNRSETKKQRMKLKETKNEKCLGVDINRNFPTRWGDPKLKIWPNCGWSETTLLARHFRRHCGPGAPVNNPCFEMYAGSQPLSENESRALATYLKKIKNDIAAYVSLHTFGQVWTTPWGFTKHRPKDYKEMVRVARLATNAMRKKFGVDYGVGASYDQIYPNSGSSTDWVYDELNIRYSYLVEMRPTPPKGSINSSFLLPPELMVQNCHEILEGITTMALNLKV